MKRAPLFLSLCALATASVSVEAQPSYEPYTFSALAGISPGTTDGPGDAARFFEPSGIAVDSAGNTFLSDTYNQTIRKITSAGVVTTFAGMPGLAGGADGTGAAATFWYPTGIAVDNVDNLYISSGHSVRKITPAGVVSTFAGSFSQSGSTDGTGTAARFNSPKGVAIDTAGNLYVADGGNHTIRKITPGAVVTTMAGLAGSPGSADGVGNAARFNDPRGVATDSSANLYVADAYNHTIRKITPAGAVTTFAGLAGNGGSADGTGSAARFLYPWSLSLDSAGNIYVADAYNDTVRRITSAGFVTTVAGLAARPGSNDGTGTAARFNLPQALIVNPAGTILVADTHNQCVRKMTPAFAVTTFVGSASIGSNDGMASAARFNNPKGVAIDAAGNRYVADSGNNTIRKISPAGVVSTLAGLAGVAGYSDGTGSGARFSAPSGVAMDGSGNVYVADLSANTIRKVTPGGTVTTFAGVGGVSGSADGQGSAARFFGPGALATDTSGNVYVTDTVNQTIRKITPAAVVTTLAGLPGNVGTADGQGSAARFNSPSAIGVDLNGMIYVADLYNHTVRKVTPGGLVTTFAGMAGTSDWTDGTGAAARFYNPQGIAVDAIGNVYVGDSGNEVVRKITSAAVVTTLAGFAYDFPRTTNGSGSSVRFSSPQGVAIDQSGTLYVAETGSNIIRAGGRTPAPANDSFANALVINAASGVLGGDNEAASLEAGEPQHAGNSGGHSLWFAWTAPQSGAVSFKATSGIFSTLLAIYTGSQLSSLTPVASASSPQSAVFYALAGTTYYIAVDGANGSSGLFNLTWNRTGPVNDEFANAQLITQNAGGVTGTSSGATAEPGESTHAGYAATHSIWYSWTAPADGAYLFDDAASYYGAVLAVYTGSSLNALNLVGESGNYYGTSQVQFQATAGTTYRIVIDSSQTYYSGATVLNWRLLQTPSNDNFANAAALTGTSGSTNGTLLEGTREPGEPSHGQYNLGSHSVWYAWTAPQDGVWVFQCNTPTFSPAVAIYTGTQVNALTRVAFGQSERVAFRATAGISYHIAVATGNDVTGDFTLNWSVGMPPANDNFVAAQLVAGTSGTVQATTVDATSEQSEPSHAGSPARHSIWYTWTAPQDGAFVFSADFNSPVMGVYLGTQVDALSELATSYTVNGSTCYVTFRAVAGTAYKIAVETGSSSPFALSWRPAAAPPNDDFGNAQEINGISGSRSGTTADASREVGEPFHDYAAGASVWYAWTAPQTGRYIFEASYTASSSPFLVVYQGNSVTRVAALGSGINPPSTQFDAVAGTAYYVELDGYYGASGAFTMQWRAVPLQTTYQPFSFTTLAGNQPGTTDGNLSSARWNQPAAIAFDPEGNAYIVDGRNHAIRKVTLAGVVSTFAGSPGQRGSADGAGLAARFNFPAGIAADSSGNVYVADRSNHTIRKITPAGVVTTLAGLAGHFGSNDGSGSEASFNLPEGIAVDAAQNVYVADGSNSTIRKITSAGVVTTLAGVPGHSGWVDGAGNSALFGYPRSIAIDATGSLFVSDLLNYTIRKVTPAGVVTTFAGSAGIYGYGDGLGASASFQSPTALSFDAGGNLFMIDTGAIRRITPAGLVSTVAGSPNQYGSVDGVGLAARFYAPTGLAVGPDANIYVTDTVNCTLRRVTPAAAVSTISGTLSPGSNDGTGAGARFDLPSGIAVDSSGNLYVADLTNHTIRKITPAGVSSTLAGLAGSYGSANGTGSAARFRSPRGVAVAPDGTVYVADTSNNTIRKITPEGVVSTFAGQPGISGSVDGTGTAARFRSPYGVALDGSGNIYVADRGNHTLRKITPNAVVTTLAGLAQSRGSNDGTGSAARFNLPRGVAADAGGNVYVADGNNHTIRKITPEGVVTTFAGRAGELGNGDGVGTDARFNFPTNLAIDSASNLFVTDRSNYLLRRIAPDGTVRTLAGKVRQNGFRDGTGDLALFDAPWGIAVNASGTLYVADNLNNTIRAGEAVLALNEAASRKAHGSAGVFDVTLPLSGAPAVEDRSGGATGDHVVVFTFNKQIASGSASVTSGSGVVAGSPGAAGSTLTVNLTGVTNAQTLSIQLDNVTDTSGQTLPATSVSIGFLIGDVNGDGVVNSGDAIVTRNRSGQEASATTFRSDVNVDGVINSGDTTIIRARSGSGL